MFDLPEKDVLGPKEKNLFFFLNSNTVSSVTFVEKYSTLEKSDELPFFRFETTNFGSSCKCFFFWIVSNRNPSRVDANFSLIQ